ncbi:MAG: redox-regulated ATPase YchF [Nitrospirae bacterium]|nr:redox-regulated ATPase YchF [Nitrospirota bacterium]
MKLIITGFSNSGKTTVFNALTGQNLETTAYSTSISADIEPQHGIVKVPDARIDKLVEIYEPKKTTYATVEYLDYLGITSGDTAQNAKVFKLLKDADAIVHVVRAFEDTSVIHPMKSIDPLRDVSSFEAELILGDLEFIEKRLEKIEAQEKKGKKPETGDKGLLLKCKAALEDEISLRDIEFNDEEKRQMLPYQLLTTMHEIIVLNINESDINSDKAKELQNKVETFFKEKGKGIAPQILTLCGKIEMEIAQLPHDEAKEFLDELGIEEPAMKKLCHVSYDALGLISFLTSGTDEVRAWTIRKGLRAQQAAGKIHSDIERGFIRAETVSYEDFIASGGDMAKAKEKGLFRQEGKAYEVKDGDIINFKFNV